MYFPALGCGTRSQGSLGGEGQEREGDQVQGGPAGRVPALSLVGAFSLSKPGLTLQPHPYHFKPSNCFLFLPTVYIFQMPAGLY